ncbi:MAG: YibE/F family protein [Patescibacteria group bacterium]|nr:YibE/F family protein [Patescibacteria group bacterium]
MTIKYTHLKFILCFLVLGGVLSGVLGSVFDGVVFTKILTPSIVQANENQTVPETETLEGIIEKVLEETETEIDGITQIEQTLECRITKGSNKDKLITIINEQYTQVNVKRYKKNDKVILTYTKDYEGNDLYFITDYNRRDGLVLLFAIFIIISILVARKNGLLSLLSMGLSFLIIVKYVLPSILDGSDPVITVILASIFIIPITFYISHGFNKKITVAIIGTLISLTITGILAHIFVNMVHLSGFSSEDALFLQGLGSTQYNLKGILLAGIIISMLGVLDDITVAQTSVIYQLHKVDSKLNFKELYKKSIKVGTHHIASMINTLVLVYTGTFLPLLLLFTNNPRPLGEMINYEIVSSEIVRTLVGSIGLILAVPITTLLGCYFVTRSDLA